MRQHLRNWGLSDSVEELGSYTTALKKLRVT